MTLPLPLRPAVRAAWAGYFARLPDPELGWVLLDQLMERGEATEVPWGLELRADGLARRARPVVGDIWETARWGRVEVRELAKFEHQWISPFPNLDLQIYIWACKAGGLQTRSADPGPYLRLYRCRGAEVHPPTAYEHVNAAWGGWVSPESWAGTRRNLLVPGDAPEWARQVRA